METIKNTAQGSKNSVCRKSTKFGPGPGLGWIWESFVGSSCRQMCFFVEKMSARKQADKKVPPKSETTPEVMSQGSLTAPLKSKSVWVINNNWTLNSNNSSIQQKHEQLHSCCSSSIVVVFVSWSISPVRLLLFFRPFFQKLIIWHALGKAWRIGSEIGAHASSPEDPD